MAVATNNLSQERPNEAKRGAAKIPPLPLPLLPLPLKEAALRWW